MGRVIFFDHLYAGPAVLGDLINVCAFKKAQTNVGVAKAVGRARIIVAIKLELRARENPIEELDVISGEDAICRLRKLRVA